MIEFHELERKKMNISSGYEAQWIFYMMPVLMKHIVSIYICESIANEKMPKFQ